MALSMSRWFMIFLFFMITTNNNWFLSELVHVSLLLLLWLFFFYKCHLPNDSVQWLSIFIVLFCFCFWVSSLSTIFSSFLVLLYCCNIVYLFYCFCDRFLLYMFLSYFEYFRLKLCFKSKYHQLLTGWQTCWIASTVMTTVEEELIILKKKLFSIFRFFNIEY